MHAATYACAWIQTLVGRQCLGVDTGAIRDTPGVSGHGSFDAPFRHAGVDSPVRHISGLSRVHKHATTLRNHALHTPGAVLVSIDRPCKRITESPLRSPSD